MPTPLQGKSTIHDIRERFDNDVERFSNLETGQSATMDAPLAMELITQAAIAATSPIKRVLDIGCGAGNNTLKLRQSVASDFDAVLLDLSSPMLERALSRLSAVNFGRIETIADDFRTAELDEGTFDVILAALCFITFVTIPIGSLLSIRYSVCYDRAEAFGLPTW